MAARRGRPARTVERVQTGVRMERRIFGVLKAVADLHGISLGDLLEGLALHAFDGKLPFGPDARKKIGALREAFGLDLRAEDSHLLRDRAPEPKTRARPETAKDKPR